jgi:membrane protease YdiL (CAAX protease family)
MMPQIENGIRCHTWVESLVYHLLPGALIGAVYYLIVPFIQAAGYPSVMALIVTAIIVLIPVELVILFWHGKRWNGKLSLKGVVIYHQKLAWWQYGLWIVVIFVSSGLIMTVLNPVSVFIEGWFTWIPENLRLGMGLSDAFTKSKLIQTFALHFVFIVIIAPAIEELYFRGFLLPRMPKNLGWAAPIVHSLLFAVYHVWSPWMFLARTLALLPLIYIVRWKKNIFLGIGAHWLINSVDFVIGVLFILQMG